jgi:hypothetical protein
MRIPVPGTAVLVTLLVGASALVLQSRPTFSLQAGSEAGRYQPALFGGQKRLHGLTYLMDTTNGRTWGMSLEDAAKAWTEVTEEEGKAPEASSTIGRYRIETTYTGSPDGAERAVTVRVDTSTGRVWQVPFVARTLRWTQIREAAQGEK